MSLAYYLPALELVVGEDDGSLRRRWELFAAEHPELLPHRCNGVTRWHSAGVLVQRITYCVGESNRFQFLDEAPAG